MKVSKRGNNFKKNYTYSSVTPHFNKNKIITLIVILLITVFVVLFAYTMFNGKSPFTNFHLTYDDSLTEEEKSFLATTIGDTPLESNLTVSATTVTTAPTDNHTVIYDILLPTTDFYSPQSTIASTAADITYTSIKDLTPTQKVLALDDNYFFDDFTSGAQFRIFTFDGSAPGNITALVAKKLNLPTKDTTLSLTQTGVTALTRGMIDVLSQQGDATYFSQSIKDFLSNADYIHLSNEVSFAEDCNVTATSTTLCSPLAMLDVIKDVDASIIELTGNHNNDYGTAANTSTIQQYHNLGIQTFGGGLSEEDAAKPLKINNKNTHLTLLGYNYSTSTKANGQGASDASPGANIYDEATAQQDITTAKANGDFVIVDVQYFECYSYPEDGGEYPACDAPISGQEEFFKHFIDLGADIVIGTQAHQPQTYELYNGKPIYYGLGNLFFDQIYWPGTTRGYALTHYFHNGEYLQTRITPHQYDETYQTKLMDEETATWFLNRLAQARAE